MQGSKGSRPATTLIVLLNFEPRVRNEIPFPLILFSLATLELSDLVWTGTAIACTLNTIPATVSLERR